MAINKKLLHFVSKSNFSTQLANSNIDSKSIVFIKDTGEIWTHDKLYSCASWGTNQTNYVPLTIGGTSYNLSKNGHTHSYLPLSGGTLTGDLEIFASNTDKFIKFTYNTTDAYAWRIGYLGTGAGNENRLAFQSAKTSGASYTDALSFGLDDLVGRFAVTPTVGNTKVSLEGHTHSNFTRTVAGLVPAPGEATTTRYLREDGAWIVPPNTPDTHWTTGIRAGVSGTNTNSVANDPFIKVLDNTTYRSQIQILGGTNITATSDATGKITIDGTHNHDTVYVKKVGDTMSGSLTATSFVKANVANSQNYLLQADGGHILKSAFSGSGHTHPYLPLTGGTLSNSQSYLSGNSFSGILEIVNTSEGVSGEEIGPHISFKGLRGASDTGSYAVYGAIGAINTAPSGLSGGALVFLTKNANGGAQTPTEQMRIATGGNVGIGTTSPSYKLDVSGTGRFTGNVTAPTFIGALSGNASSATLASTLTIKSSASASWFDILWNSGTTVYGSTGSKLRVQPSTGSIASGGTITASGGNSGEWNSAYSNMFSHNGSLLLADVQSTSANVGRKQGSYSVTHTGFSSHLVTFKASGSTTYLQLWKTNYGIGGDLKYRSSTDSNLVSAWRTIYDSGNFSVTLNGTSTTSANFYAPTKQLSVQSGTNSYLIGASSTTSLGTVYSNAGIYMNGSKLYTGDIQASGNITAPNLWGIASKSVSLTLTTNWQDTGILLNDSTLFSSGSGTYIIELSSDTPGVSSQWAMRYSGVMAVFTTQTNSTDTDEIILHSMGHARNGRHIYLRTVLQASPNYAKIQIATSASWSGAGTITIKTRRII